LSRDGGAEGCADNDGATMTTAAIPKTMCFSVGMAMTI
jgi:hypothetical protein